MIPKSKSDSILDLNVEERIEYGKSLRKKTSRSSQSQWNPPSDRPDPIEILIKSNHDRIPDLIPVRFGRMKKTSFDFLRGAAAIMASDLSFTTSSGLLTQCCGDCHLKNFGAYATPERNIFFEINDFDETLRAPWEWDLKRLTASFVVAGNYRNFPEKIIRKAVLDLAESYCEGIHRFSVMKILDVWYSKIDGKLILKTFSGDKDYIKSYREAITNKFKNSPDNSLQKIIKIKNSEAKFIDNPPYLYHSKDIEAANKESINFFANYKKTLSPEKKILFEKYKFSDVAYKVAGVGSIGTRCYLALFIAEPEDVLLLQVKEARQSVLEPYTHKSEYKNNGERIVIGQRLMQAASDIFLGWAYREDGRQFYVRQYRDTAIATNIDSQTKDEFIKYASLCGKALSKSHSKNGDVAAMSGYIGKSKEFEKAISEFAFQYAEQNEKDYKEFLIAIKSGRIEAFEC